MSRLIKALKAFGKKCNTSATEPTGKTLSEVINSIATNFNITGAKGDKGDKGNKGDTGAYVTAIALTTEDGAVTGGTATLSDNTEVTITVTEAEDATGDE